MTGIPGRIVMVVLVACWAGVCVAQEGPPMRFSVYLAPGVAKSGRKLTVVDDLHYGLGEQHIPIYVKEGRQSIEYPYQGGGKLILFRLETRDGEPARVPVVSVDVPSSAKQGVLVLVPEEGGRFQVKPLWLGAGRLAKGRGVIYNLAKRDVLMVFGGKRKEALKAGQQFVVDGKALGDSGVSMTKLDVYVQKKRESGMDTVKVLSRSIMIPQDDTSLFLLVPKQRDYLTLLTLSAGGADDPARQAELLKNLPSKKPKEP